MEADIIHGEDVLRWKDGTIMRHGRRVIDDALRNTAVREIVPVAFEGVARLHQLRLPAEQGQRICLYLHSPNFVVHRHERITRSCQL